jgi:hypothetical protein
VVAGSSLRRRPLPCALPLYCPLDLFIGKNPTLVAFVPFLVNLASLLADLIFPLILVNPRFPLLVLLLVKSVGLIEIICGRLL